MTDPPIGGSSSQLAGPPSVPQVEQRPGTQFPFGYDADFPAMRRKPRGQLDGAGGHQNQDQAKTALHQDPRCLESVKARHAHVHEYEIRTQRGHGGDRLLAGSGLADMGKPRGGCDQLPKCIAEELLVVDAEHPYRAPLAKTH